MKEISQDELLSLQIDILKKVDAFCRANTIPYTIYGGTCIGAVRHQGYIPWDDDIDIAMTRPNYERFIHSFNGKIEHLDLYAPELNWNYYAPYANVCDNRTILDEGENGHHGMEIGVKIDVFPIDVTPADTNEYMSNVHLINHYWHCLSIKRIKMNLVWKSSKRRWLSCLKEKALLLFQSYSGIQKKIRKIAVKYSDEETNHVTLVCYHFNRDTRCSKQAFDEYIDVPFENITVSMLKGYDECLTKFYGDYMKLPPEEQRVPHHGFTAYWKDKD